MQIAYISNRPEVLRETLVHVEHFMPWVDDVLVVAPAASIPSFVLGRSVTFISDDEAAGDLAPELPRLDHSSCNYVLRRGMIKSGAVAEQFVMSDDDYRPIKPVPLDVFVEDGRHHCYYSYDLAAWRRAETDFDNCQRVTYQALRYLGYSHLSFAAHMPQVIDRQVLADAFDAVAAITDSNALCEWSLYFNYGRRHRPDLFHAPRVFRTMCWPEYPNEWPYWVRPEEYTFENFYPSLYEPGQLFQGLTTALDADTVERTNFEKILRWSQLEVRTAKLDFPTDVGTPWLKDSWSRRAFFRLARSLRKVYDYVALEDRVRLNELAGAVDRLEHEAETGSGS
ncbi:MAG: hypothetical protein JJLCMIEE_01785 [Acidimicrobiales bacterium]|nr:MAG: hypothetical protein EDR02_05770 [Actinomycetota bacterium]MBV6508719.1 hypothetical protein [Acidimicrobiales bacterium]RIK08150.1 MAG: hypothetical protein DCC48_01890 [Acidobacteriota bacterium]